MPKKSKLISNADIYTQVEEALEEARGNWKDFFCSDIYSRFLNARAANLVQGCYESLRTQGMAVSKSLIETELKRMHIEKIYDPTDTQRTTAWCKSTDKAFVVGINGAGAVVSSVDELEEKHEIVVGHLIHEIGHRLFTDFPAMFSRCARLESNGQWYPLPPKRLNTPDGIMLERNLGDETYRKLFVQMCAMIDNATEDGYIEAELNSHYPGMASVFLGAKNAKMLAISPSLTDEYNKPEINHFDMVYGQLLIYAKYHTLKLGTMDASSFEPTVMEAIYEGMDIVDEILDARDPRKRCQLNNELSVLCARFMDETIQELQNNQNQGNGGGQGQGQGQGNGLNQNIATQLLNMINSIASQAGILNHSTDNKSKSLVDPNSTFNSGLQQTVSKGAAGTQTPGSGGTDVDLGCDHSAAKQDLESMLQQAALEKSLKQAEENRTQALNEEAASFDYSGIKRQAPKVERAQSVSEENKAGYHKACGRALAVSRKLAQILLKKLKTYQEGERLDRLYNGRKFQFKSWCKDKQRPFSKNTLPIEVPNLAVYVLVDESGSVSEELTAAEMETCIVLEDFCRTVDVPLCIQGYTSDRGEPLIFSYVELEKIDDMDKYRLTGIASRGGTPTVESMLYALGRLRKWKESKKILFVITDGGDDNDKDGTVTQSLIAQAKKDHIAVVACGIGKDKASVVKEFGQEHYMDMDDITTMPEQLVDIIRRNMDGVR